VLAKAHGLRNTAEYEGGLEEDEQLLAEMLSAAEAVADAAQRLGPVPRKNR
jgi:hypothetical protein